MDKKRLSVLNVSLLYGHKTILDGLQLNLQTGDIVGLLGRNGAGKSSLMQVLSGSIKKSSYKAFLDDNAVDLRDQSQQLVGYLPQDPFLMKGLKVTDAVQAIHENPEQQDLILYEPMIHAMHHKKVGVLSMGERRFLEFLIIFYLPHRFVMLDEPFSGLAPLQIERVKEVITTNGKHKGILLSDHYYRHVTQIAPTNWMLNQGKLTCIAPADVDMAYKKD